MSKVIKKFFFDHLWSSCRYDSVTKKCNNVYRIKSLLAKKAKFLIAYNTKLDNSNKM